MSWDASFSLTEELLLRDWNYTHNCDRMISTVLEEQGYTLEEYWLTKHMGKSWYRRLNGLSGSDGFALLDLIVKGLEKEPDRFIAMNPSNGWGSYETLLPILRDMRETSKAYPEGRWKTLG